ncbi:hypothetical protein [Paenibacillus sp. CF384]|uniref:hypothetical protein n=1 Tax=Paenibacillus sp. CF384 TaxID=1884382 RepID=UPI00089A7713|nr:hypothetical protein [Paenibacillus sp. CF384]SDX03942.1 hypothetical protein SAMN05518855_100814 [Paenibacillus sp. CF384]
METIGLIILTVFVVIVTLMFVVGVMLDFIKPSVLQVQLLGIQLTLFGILIVVAFHESTGFGMTIGIVGLVVGVFGSFREKADTTNSSGI